MTGRLRIVANISFSVEERSAGDGPGRSTTGSVHGSGGDLYVDFSRTPSLLGSSTRPLVRPLADALDRQGLTVHLSGPAGPLLHIGHGVEAPWWQVLLTRSRRLRLASVRRVVASWRGPRVFEAALPPEIVLPTPALLHGPSTRTALVLRGSIRRLTGHRR